MVACPKFRRLQTLAGRGSRPCFLWGPRQTGKSTLLKELFPTVRIYDLLLSEEFERLVRKPSILREEVLASPAHHRFPVVIDEVQKIPSLLDEIHWLIRERSVPFILCGSSPRKLIRGGAGLLGGRALRYELHPLVYPEIPGFDLVRALNHGLLAPHYVSDDPGPQLHAYVGSYLREEVAAEGLARSLPVFARFLESAAFSNGEIINYQNVASDCGVSRPTATAYFDILSDTLIGRFLPSFRKRPKRRVIQAPKFYFFDVGLANMLLKRGRIETGGEAFGKALEHFVHQEIIAHSHYTRLGYPLSFWRTASQLEVDFILGEGEVAVEVKAVAPVSERHLRGLRAFREEYGPRRSVVLSLDARPRVIDGIQVLPWREFLDELWAGKLIR